jgi:hypothetical protein
MTESQDNRIQDTSPEDPQDDTQGNAMREVGEHDPEGGRFRPTAVPEDDDTAGHRKMSATGDEDGDGQDGPDGQYAKY